MLKARGLTVLYEGFEALNSADMDLAEGQWLMAVGPNGAGKSTLLKAIAQMVPYTGTVQVMGRNARELSARETARWMSVLQQKQTLSYPFSVEELVMLGRYAHQNAFSRRDPGGRAKVDEAIGLCGLSNIRRQNALTLSGGELQRAFLAQVFAQDAPILLLDEPASHLDLAYQKEIFSLIADWLKTPGRAALCVVHDLQLAMRYGTHAMLMNSGRCEAAGTMEEVLTPSSLSRVYGIDVPGWLSWLHEPWENMDNTAGRKYNRARNERA